MRRRLVAVKGWWEEDKQWLLNSKKLYFEVMKNGLEVEVVVAQHWEGMECHWIVHIKVLTAMLNGFHVNNKITVGRLGSTYIYTTTYKIGN